MKIIKTFENYNSLREKELEEERLLKIEIDKSIDELYHKISLLDNDILISHFGRNTFVINKMNEDVVFSQYKSYQDYINGYECETGTMIKSEEDLLEYLIVQKKLLNL